MIGLTYIVINQSDMGVAAGRDRSSKKWLEPVGAS